MAGREIFNAKAQSPKGAIGRDFHLYVDTRRQPKSFCTNRNEMRFLSRQGQRENSPAIYCRENCSLGAASRRDARIFRSIGSACLRNRRRCRRREAAEGGQPRDQ
jgi:hypothetical protein